MYRRTNYTLFPAFVAAAVAATRICILCKTIRMKEVSLVTHTPPPIILGRGEFISCYPRSEQKMKPMFRPQPNLAPHPKT